MYFIKKLGTKGEGKEGVLKHIRKQGMVVINKQKGIRNE